MDYTFMRQFVQAARARDVDAVAALLADRRATRLIAECFWYDTSTTVMQRVLSDPRVEPSA